MSRIFSWFISAVRIIIASILSQQFYLILSDHFVDQAKWGTRIVTFFSLLSLQSDIIIASILSQQCESSAQE